MTRYMAEMLEKATLVQVVSEYERQYFDGEVLSRSESVEGIDGYRGILEYLGSTGSSRRNYRHYATRRRIASILDDSAFYLTDGRSWNDKYDRERFNPRDSSFKRFGICFSAMTSESIAMWMLYGGIDGNGAMINFDKGTLRAAMLAPEYECGYFDHGRFCPVGVLDASDMELRLMDVLYFGGGDGDGKMSIGRVGESGRTRIAREALRGIEPIAKHKSWSYEVEVRLVAAVSKSVLGDEGSKIEAIRIPLKLSGDFRRRRVFDSPVSDGSGGNLDSELHGMVEWDLCSGCGWRVGEGLHAPSA
ncbi:MULTISPECIES: hypothetical protein [unclassified Adlercreutzia]|uniref:hypothetical protein n=1 Tax=unclassified Adlercreutzia TaxID=2636013 RepID=UPI0013EB79D2|nr:MULTISPECIES: hypothetical protein [unclassified Adlercreutzia]